MQRSRTRIAQGALVVALVASLVSPSAHATGGFDVAAENARTGTPHWQVTSKEFTKQTLAFVDRTSVLPGESFGLYVSCHGSGFTMRALRVGDYAGLGARAVWTSPTQPCVVQRAPRVDTATNEATAPWKRSLDITTNEWPEGMYVLKVKSDDGSATYVDLVLRSRETAGRVVLVSSTQTFEAYNQWGGANAYRGTKGFSTRARVVSYDRPNTWGAGSGKFIGYEAPLVRRAEALGLPLAYLADTDITANPAILDGATSIVFGGHAEYWTQYERDAVMRARDNGTNLLFFGANTAYWRVRLASSDLGARRVMDIYKSRSSDPNKTKPSIRFRDTGQPDSGLTVVTYNCFPARGTFTVTEPLSWVFQGADVHKGQTFAGIIGPEIDKMSDKVPGTAVLAYSPATCGKHATHSTMVLSHAASGAATFAVGTMGWVPKVLQGEAPAESVQLAKTITDNVLRASTVRGLA